MDNFSNLMMIGECLLDKKRTLTFKKAIEQTVQLGDIVLDAGTGSGILAMLAAKAGATKVYAIEINPDVAEFTKSNIHKNNLSDIIEVINADLKDIKLPNLDVVIMEMMDTGLIAEQQIPAMNRLIDTNAVSKKTKVIPNFYETYIQFCNYNFNFYGCDMSFIIQARNFGVHENIDKKMTDKVLISNIDLTKRNEKDFSCSGSSIARFSGKVNAIILTARIRLTEDIVLNSTTDMNMPIIVPIDTIAVTKGDLLKFEIKYLLSHGFQSITFSWK